MNTLHKLNIPTTRGIVLITLVNRDDFDIPAYALKRGKNRDYFAPFGAFNDIRMVCHCERSEAIPYFDLWIMCSSFQSAVFPTIGGDYFAPFGGS